MVNDFLSYGKQLIDKTVKEFERKQWAKEQRSKHKVNFDDLKEEFKEYGYLLLSISDDRKRIAYYLCCRHYDKGIQHTQLSNFRHRKSACRHCRTDKVTNARRLSNEEVINVLDSKNLEWIDGQYQGIDSVLTVRCKDHSEEIFQDKYYLIKQRRAGCEKCNNPYNQHIDKSKNINKSKTNQNSKQKVKQKRFKKRKSSLTIEDVIPYFEKLGLELLETEYVNNSTKMKCSCKTHGLIYKTYASVKNGRECRHCFLDKMFAKNRTPYDQVFKEFDEKGFILLEKNYKNGSTPLRCKCKHHVDYPDLYISRDNLIKDKHGCKYCWNEKRRGETAPNWRGGLTPLIEYLRININQWKLDSMKFCSHKCVITGKRFDDIHHLYSMHNIVAETFNDLDLRVHKNISDYSNDELTKIINKCLEIHYKYPLGVCLTRDIHELFHKLYGYIDNTPEQFEEFKIRYNNGEFDNLLVDKEVV